MQVASARNAYDVAVLADQLSSQECRFHPCGKLKAFERRVPLARRGILRADGPGFVWIDQCKICVHALSDVAFRVKAKAARRVQTRELCDPIVREAALQPFRYQRRQQILGAAETRFHEPYI